MMLHVDNRIIHPTQMWLECNSVIIWQTPYSYGICMCLVPILLGGVAMHYSISRCAKLIISFLFPAMESIYCPEALCSISVCTCLSGVRE